MTLHGIQPTWSSAPFSSTIAGEYSEFSHSAFWGAYHYHGAIALYHSGVAVKGGDVLELGTGPGWLTIVMRQIYSHAHYAVLDHSPEMLQVARHNFDKAGFSDIACNSGVAEDLPFPDNSFDLITSQSMFRHLADKAAALREAYRVIRPGGLVYISDLVDNMDQAEKDFLCDEAPGLNGPTFIRAAVDSAISAEEVQGFITSSGVPKWECLIGGLGGFALTSRQVVEWCKRGFPLRNLRTSSEATEWSRRLFAHWIHIYLYK